MSEYRTPDEDLVKARHEARVTTVLETAVHNAAMLKAAIAMAEPAEVVELWVDRFWNELRDNLSDERPDDGGMRIEDRLCAISLLLADRIAEAADDIMRTIHSPGVA